MSESKNPSPRFDAGRDKGTERYEGGGGALSGRILVRVVVQATLRCGAASAALRFAIKAARRDPRAQGMTVSFSAVAFVIDLIKRALVFMCSSSVSFVALSVLPC